MSTKSRIAAPKGTRDFYPEEMRLQRHIFNGWNKACRSFGYEEYEGPTFEHLQLYVDKSGPEIMSQLYHFPDKGGRDLALRPELTPTLARMINQKGKSLRLPVKWYSIPRLYRYEKAQRGRLREFYQLNMDIIGTSSLWAEVDLFTAIVEMLQMLNLSEKDFRIKISSRKVISEFLDRWNLEEQQKLQLYGLLDKRAKLPGQAFITELEKAGLDQNQISQLNQLLEVKGATALAEISKSVMGPALSELQELLKLLDQVGISPFVELDLSIVRGLAYYTGIVFEVYDIGAGLRAIAGGGRYDNLMASLGGEPLTGVGFGMGDVVLTELLKDRNLLPGTLGDLDYFIASFDGPDSGLMKLASIIRRRGKTVNFSLEKTKLKKQMNQANEAGAKRVLFYGSQKAESGKYEIKDLVTGEQFIVAGENL